MKMQISCSIIAFLLGASLSAQSLVLTFDDGPNLDPTPKLSAAERNQRLLDAFRAKGVRVVLFTNGIRGGNTLDGWRWLTAWGNAGHRIGNHSYSHGNLAEISTQTFIEDFEKMDHIIKPLPGYWRMFRFPFLEEGKDEVQSKDVQAFLKQKGYRNAPVSVVTYDWAYNGKLHEMFKANPNADIAPLRELYLAHILECLKVYDSLGQDLLGRKVAHAILLHHNLLNSLVMPDLLAMLERSGWKVVNPEEGYSDALYQQERADVGYSDSVLVAVAKKKKEFVERCDKLKAKLWEDQKRDLQGEPSSSQQGYKAAPGQKEGR